MTTGFRPAASPGTSTWWSSTPEPPSATATCSRGDRSASRPSALSRAGLVWLKGEGEVDVLGRPWVRARHRPFALVDPEGALRPLDALAGKAVLPFAAIARPEAFARTAAALGGSVVPPRWFPDHHFFTPGELSELRSQAGDAVLLTTEKDRVRLPAGFPAWAVRLEVELVEGEATLAALLGG